MKGNYLPVDMNINPLNVYLGCLLRSATAERSLKVSSLAVEPMFIHRSADGRTVMELGVKCFMP